MRWSNSYISLIMRFLLLFILPLSLLAQWNTDPSVNNVLYTAFSDSTRFILADQFGEDGFVALLAEGNSSLRFLEVDSSGLTVGQLQVPGGGWNEYLQLVPDHDGGIYLLRVKLQQFDSLIVQHIDADLNISHLYAITGPFFSVPQWTRDMNHNLRISILTENSDTTDWEALSFRIDTGGLIGIDTLLPLFAPTSTVRFTYLENGGHLETYNGYLPGTVISVPHEILYNSLGVPIRDLWDSLPSVTGEGSASMSGDIFVRFFKDSTKVYFMAVNLSTGLWNFHALAPLTNHPNLFGRAEDWKSHIDAENEELVVLMKTRSSYLNHLILLRFDLNTGQLIREPQYLHTQQEEMYVLDIAPAGNRLILAYMSEYGDILYFRYSLKNHYLTPYSSFLRRYPFAWDVPDITTIGTQRKSPVYVWRHVDWFGYFELRAMALSENGALSIDEEFQEVPVYPNPFQDVIHIGGDPEGSIHYEITDALGRTIKTGSLEHSRQIRTTELSSGQYFLSVRTESGNQILQTIFKY